MKTAILLALMITIVACGSTNTTEESVDKVSVHFGKADVADLCKKYNQPADCDLCETQGWYGDGECDQTLIDDGYCEGPDPDCENVDEGLYVSCNDGDMLLYRVIDGAYPHGYRIFVIITDQGVVNWFIDQANTTFDSFDNYVGQPYTLPKEFPEYVEIIENDDGTKYLQVDRFYSRFRRNFLSMWK
jgi:hypothetical protein